jgi:uncharacterized membrane protein
MPTVLFVLALHLLVMSELTGLREAAGVRLSSGRAVVVLLGAVLIAVGNLLPQTRPNVAFGLRTSRTLSNAQLWQHVHRAGRYAAVGLGLVIAVAGVLLRDEAFGAVVAGAALLGGLTVMVTYRRHAGA